MSPSASSVSRVCLLGHSGIGKSPLSALFRGDGFEPLRVRKPRGLGDSAISRSKFDDERKERSGRKPLLTDSAEGSWSIEVHEDVSFLKVRDTDQLLKHPTECPEDIPMRVEVYAPILERFLQLHAKGNLPPSLANWLAPHRMLIFVLNPTRTSFAQMQTPTDELRIAVYGATTQRALLQGKTPNLPDTLERIRSLETELSAWRSILGNSAATAVECIAWPFFEYRYLEGDAGQKADILCDARKALLDAIYDPATSARRLEYVKDEVAAMMLSEKEIRRIATVTAPDASN